MKCRRCTEDFHLADHIKEKIEIIGESGSEIYCDNCRECYVCKESDQLPMNRCNKCGYHYHIHHKKNIGNVKAETEEIEKIKKESICNKCIRLKWKIDFLSLIGPEIPFFEQKVEDLDQEIMKKVRNIERKTKAPIKSSDGIKEVFLGKVRMVPLFPSSHLEEYAKYASLYLCNGCLSYFASKYVLNRHRTKCKIIYPPGKLVYYDTDNVCIFEVEGKKRQEYCQSLCLLAKMFLSHKTLYYDVDPFLFYIVGETKENEFTMQGYFSKETEEGSNNLSCIVVFPPYRSKGLGSLLIDFSYHLTKESGPPPYTSGPEQPLSDAGEAAYMRYWQDTIVKYVTTKKHNLEKPAETLEKISKDTGISIESLEKAYKEMLKKHGKEILSPEFLSKKCIIKQARKIKKMFLI